MKRLLSIVAAFSVMMSIQVSSNAEETYTAGDWVYSSATGNIVAWAGTDTDVVIPANSVVDSSFGFKSKGLMSATKKNYVDVRSLTISQNVKIEGDIGLSASSLEKVIFNNNAEDMPDLSIYFSGNTRLTSLHLPENLKQIESGMCYGCTNLKNIYIPDTVEVIGKSAFENCTGLDSITLPRSLKTVDNKAFDGCNNLQSIINMPADYKNIYASGNLSNIVFAEEPEKNKEFYQHFFRTDWMQNTVFPNVKEDFLITDGYLVKYLGNSKNVTIPDGVQVIGEDAFYKSDIEEVTIPEQVKRINVAAFKLCKNLKELTLPKSLEYVETSAFSECFSLSKLTINGNTSFEDNVFDDCSALTDAGITVNGKIVPLFEGGIETNPFAFTNTAYNKDGYVIPNTPAPQTPVPTATVKPEISETGKPSAKPSESVSATPKPSEKPDNNTAVKPLLSVKQQSDKLIIRLDNKNIEFDEDAQPFIDENGRTQIPIRAVAEAMGAEVDWDNAAKTAVIIKNGITVIITIDNVIMKVGNKNIIMDTAAQIINDRTYIPIRFVGEALGMTVNWAGE